MEKNFSIEIANLKLAISEKSSDFKSLLDSFGHACWIDYILQAFDRLQVFKNF